MPELRRATPQTSGQLIEGTLQRTIPSKRPDPMTREECEALLRKVFDGRGFKALGKNLIVRVGSPPEKSAGGIWFPKGSTGPALYDDRLGSKVHIVGDVLAAGDEAHVRCKHMEPFQPGDRVFFSRLNFAWIKRVEGEDEDRGDWIGFVDPVFLEGFVE